ncbi:protein serine/threonine phosphatase 2C [Cucurbitaria berberidis CBS 394.84]|uniref:Protein serine/threonine phosphatase 2C n=1 Tax=Cucurbitaria berberidis CBS 394.84 TaxID=1168544 RepID=A0A9P4GMI1_9PLEO|nr:protein serine/threonine phosphatase 2C [Cucurbitaria berberidis CBS 394.84]KAF1848041.1 protein serine/threonine phosphatase 2C [Cucurbitaria berberidis CBS 394.84]
MTDDKLVQEALQARNWLFGILDCHDQLFGREREMRMFRVAVEKELAGGEGEWSGKDMEKLYMALTHCKLTSPEDRLKAAFALVLHLNFAEHLKDVSELAAIRTARTHRAAPMDAEIEETRELIFEKARLIKVDQFACAIPLSVLTTVSTPSTIDDNAGCCPICQSSYNDLSAFPISELLADYPVRIKHCGHIIGKACLAQWMVTPKIDEAKYPHRTCPMCRVEIEGVDAFEKPDSLLQWLRKDRRAIETVKDLVYGYGLEFEECCDVVVQTMSEDIACEELMAEVRKMRSKREDDGAFEKEEAFLKETMDDLKKEKWAWGFRGDGVWRKLRQEWMNTSAIINIVDYGVSTILGSRADQEDRYCALNIGQLKSRKEVGLFAVYDGHGGTETVDYVSEHLVTHIEQQFAATSRTLEPEEYKQAIQRAIKAVDKDLDRADLRGGSTVALALIDTKQGVLIEVDLGDSHVVFSEHQFDSVIVGGSSDDGNAISEEGWKVEVLSEEHAPDNPEERKRIEQAGGEINYITGIPRIGGVSMARALGDVQYKKPRVNRLAGHDLSDLAGVHTGVAPGKTVKENLVSNKAHSSIRHLQGQSLILLASDGVGDAKDAEEVTRLAVDRWNQGKAAKDIAEELTSREALRGGADNCTVVVVVVDTEHKGRRSIDSPRMSLDVPLDVTGSRRRRRSSMASLKDWIRG